MFPKLPRTMAQAVLRWTDIRNEPVEQRFGYVLLENEIDATALMSGPSTFGVQVH